jgi:N utilization substance protein A
MDETPALMFQRILRVSESFAHAFEEAGYTSIEEIGYVPFDELTQLKDIPEWALTDVRQRARQHLLDEAERRSSDGGADA